MKPITFLMLLCVGIVSAQQTLSLPEGDTSPKANLEQVAWIEGHWKGEAFGGIAEEIWSPPLGNSMMFVFRLVNDGKVSFYESGHIQQVDETLILQLKHFDGNMRGWEEKDKTIDFKLVKIEPNKVYFDGFTIERINENQIDMWVLIESEGTTEEVQFVYKRV
ncbi:DUF6265 family protein [Allomuricauda sp. NBRC 101325]|uniref:DUF6265 family protein n=1 Tax=Allomuricauda sp. NBRC 101325 TaxID=1113758 RepID=UPI0024A192E9|nr:DUF6265 family protein [Muricauda sp. NBRC 101325]GLU42947.1 hypothetical protein Musp01_05710 [Muricauda sp. NBRC 101325]